MPTRSDVMTRVKTVRGVRTIVASPLATGLLGFALACYLSAIVSMGDILTNTMMHGGWSARFFYALSSLVHSRFIVQTLALLITLAVLRIAFKSLRKLWSFTPFGSAQQI